MPTSTVEDYLKCILVEEQRSAGQRVPTGRIAASLGLAPGTVTAMMKTLTESELVEYTPYGGVKLRPSGRRLATRVLRRHRLVELFLVRIMGMSWSEVHEEAEVLEHAVSEGLIERMDEMLGRPSADPHGDPIPTAGGRFDDRDRPDLLSCEAGTALLVARVVDQRADFLELLERHGVMPGRRVVVSQRDELTETLRIAPQDGEPLQLGFQAASKVLVEREPFDQG